MLFKETKHASIPTGHAFLTFLCFLEDGLSALAPYLLSLQLLINAVTQGKKKKPVESLMNIQIHLVHLISYAAL